MNLYDIEVTKMNGDKIKLEDYKDKVLLIVNTATGCGFTPQYVGLQELYKTYNEKGFEILDFPCNQFAGQAPGSDEEIHEFCVGRYAVSFPQFSKIDVNGENEAPLYTYLKDQKKGLVGKNIKWNFTKFLIDRNGNVIKRFAPNVKPEKIEKDIVALLK